MLYDQQDTLLLLQNLILVYLNLLQIHILCYQQDSLLCFYDQQNSLLLLQNLILVYLSLLQIRFYYQQDSLLCFYVQQDSLLLLQNNDTLSNSVIVTATPFESSADAISATMMKTSIQAYSSSLYYDTNLHDSSYQSLDNNNEGVHDEYMYVFDAAFFAIIMMTVVFHELPLTIHDGIPFAVNNGISSATSAKEALYNYHHSYTAVSILNTQ